MDADAKHQGLTLSKTKYEETNSSLPGGRQQDAAWSRCRSRPEAARCLPEALPVWQCIQKTTFGVGEQHGALRSGAARASEHPAIPQASHATTSTAPTPQLPSSGSASLEHPRSLREEGEPRPESWCFSENAVPTALVTRTLIGILPPSATVAIEKIKSNKKNSLL